MSTQPAWNGKNLPRLTPRMTERLMAVAAGRRFADRIIRNVHLVNVHIPRLEENRELAILGDRIAAIGDDLGHLIGKNTEVIDGRHQIALPGMIDPHTHLDSMFTVREFARLALASGNTTAMSETAMIAGAAGPDGVSAFIDEARAVPMRVFFLAPPQVPPFPDFETSAGLNFEGFKTLLRQPDVIGVGENYWRPALDLRPGAARQLAAARTLGLTREGHAAGARGFHLQAYRAGGITSCHEATTPKDVLERLALGLAVQIREGYVRSELPAMGPLADMKGLDTRRLMLCSDLASFEMLLRTGVMNEVVRRAVAVGFKTLQAIQMVTLNPADYFGLTGLGRLDPGALADLVLVDRLDRLTAELVMVGGRVVARKGMLTVNMPYFQYDPVLRRTFKLKRLDPADFTLPAPNRPVKVRIVDMFNETITREAILEIQGRRLGIQTDPENDLVKVAVWNKHSASPRGGVGLARGWGLRHGAVATSLLWDNNNLLCVGVTDREMAMAANRVLELQGGLAVVRGRRVLAEMPMPVGGIISEKPLPELAREMNDVEKAIRGLGSLLDRPFLALQTFCFTGLPFIRLTDRGLLDVRRGKMVSVVL